MEPGGVLTKIFLIEGYLDGHEEVMQADQGGVIIRKTKGRGFPGPPTACFLTKGVWNSFNLNVGHSETDQPGQGFGPDPDPDAGAGPGVDPVPVDLMDQVAQAMREKGAELRASEGLEPVQNPISGPSGGKRDHRKLGCLLIKGKGRDEERKICLNCREPRCYYDNVKPGPRGGESLEPVLDFDEDLP